MKNNIILFFRVKWVPGNSWNEMNLSLIMTKFPGLLRSMFFRLYQIKYDQITTISASTI